MANARIIQIKDRAPAKALASLNRITGLNWTRHPASLVPNGLLINGADRDRLDRQYDAQQRQA